MELLQQSEYELTNLEVHIKDLEQNSGYHVHIVSCQARNLGFVHSFFEILNLLSNIII